MNERTENKLLTFLAEYEAAQQAKRAFWLGIREIAFWGLLTAISFWGLVLGTKVVWRVFDL